MKFRSQHQPSLCFQASENRALNSSKVILPSPSVSSFFIKASHFFLLMAWLILPSSAVVMYPELSLSIACSNNNHVVSPRGLEVTLKARTALSRCSVLLCWSTCSFRTSDLTLHLSFILIYHTKYQSLPLCEVKECIPLNEARFIRDSV